MSEKYRLMTYFAIGTLHFYRKDIVMPKDGETLGDFAEKNAAVIKRVCDEAKSLFGYELSHEQVGRAVGAYLTEPRSVTNTGVATLKS